MAKIKVLEMLVEVLIGAVVVGALIGTAITSLTNITTGGVNNSSLLPESLTAFNVFFTLIIPLLIIFGIVKVFQRMTG